MDRMRREAIQRSMALHQPECMMVPEFEVVETIPISDAVMPEGIQIPLEGIWQERLSTTACEETATENMVHAFTDEGQQTFALVRGTTRASLDTQLTLIGEAREIAATHDYAEGCDVIRFSDTHVATQYTESYWEERWDADACGRRVRLDITFTSDAGSVQTYNIHLIN